MNNELLARIERLEQAIQDIWAACSCLRKDLEEIPPNPEDLCGGEDFNCEPTCPECDQWECICGNFEEEEPEEPEEEVHD